MDRMNPDMLSRATPTPGELRQRRFDRFVEIGGRAVIVASTVGVVHLVGPWHGLLIGLFLCLL